MWNYENENICEKINDLNRRHFLKVVCCFTWNLNKTAAHIKPTVCRVVIYLQKDMSGDTCLTSLCSTSGAKPKTCKYRGGSFGNKYVRLNVGGSLYYTTVKVLTRHDTMLKAMFSGRMEVLTDKEGWILIDRCGKHFGAILSYLRDDSVVLPKSTQEIKELMAEAKYYLIQELVDICQAALQEKKDCHQPVCTVPVITSTKEEDQLIAIATKPVVKLLYNRSNNKYSYTVEFPEARIYEETLNILLYETPRVPDNSLLEATSRNRSQASNSEDEEVFELRDRVRRIHVKRYSTYDDRQLSHQSAYRD
ncbi:BTB/POZ domain-containing adapter for CUL3-mediated RhoA degradation protein 2 [Protopterus annectens]|uniref:BTB/POZ domain-containing adapter for CUL3-mediated RhoA degradation protein 2 n=1 Tax=Protopterus annectens TaxID=7888 RepID=UPI001CFBA14C|nr:BTB/POZ domain-containing adapter for CUL3-mediated RhoA degradation protein 2 [Protopterus annectens]